MNAWFWAIGAVLIAIAELHFPGCYLIWIAAGVAVTALLSFAYDLSLHSQVQVFIASTIVACVGGYFIYRNIFGPVRKEGSLNEQAKQMIGKKGIVFEPIINGHGKVRLGDTVWLAEGPDLKD